MKKFLTLLITMISLTGCIRMTCMSPSCLGEETYNNLMHPKPYGAHRIKDGMTRESRRADSWSCGAANTVIAADGVIFSAEKRAAARLPSDQNDYGPDGRLTKEWIGCMQSKGYVYLENCDARCLYP